MALPAVTVRYAFFTGKGGVGKTSLSCATGLALSEAGRASPDREHRSGLQSRRSAWGPSRFSAFGDTGRARNRTPLISTRKLPRAITKSAWSAPFRGVCRQRPSQAWRNSSPEPAPWKSPPSTSLPSCSAIKRDGGLRPRDFRYSAHRPHLAPSNLAFGLERFYRVIGGRRIVPWAARPPGNAKSPIRGHR